MGQAAGHTLSLGCAGVMAKNKAFTILQEFMARCPQVQVSIQHGFYDDIIDDFFQSGKFDLIVTRKQDSIDQEIFDWQECRTGPIRAVLGKGHPLAGKASVTLEELLQIPYVALFPPKRAAVPAEKDERGPQLLGITPTNILEADGVNTADMMVACGMGYILLSEDLREGYHTDQFAYLPIEGITQGFPLWCIWRQDNANPELPRFLEACQDFFS